MEKLKLINPDYKGYVNKVRYACRGIVIDKNKILISYESKKDQYIIPGGGIEEGETLEECCVREIKEETGYLVKVLDKYLEIEELFDTMKHFNYYFSCEVLENTGEVKYTKGEINAGYVFMWKELDEVIDIFSKYDDYKEIKEEKYGLYKREYEALMIHKKFIEK